MHIITQSTKRKLGLVLWKMFAYWPNKATVVKSLGQLTRRSATLNHLHPIELIVKKTSAVFGLHIKQVQYLQNCYYTSPNNPELYHKKRQIQHNEEFQKAVRLVKDIKT